MDIWFVHVFVDAKKELRNIAVSQLNKIGTNRSIRVMNVDNHGMKNTDNVHHRRVSELLRMHEFSERKYLKI